MAIGLITYQDASRREDLVDIITNVSPRETPLLSGLPMGPNATQTLHEYLTDSFASAADNAQAESSAFTVTDLVAPARANNVTQIFRDDIQVSGTERAVSVGGAVDPYNYQINKNLVEHAKDIELALMAGSRASGNSGVARRLEGVINGISTNSTTRSSGSSLGETIFNDIIEMVYNQTDMVADEIYVGGTLKRDISGFSGRGAGTDYILQADDPRIINSADIYVSDFGVHKVFLHRDVPNGANAKGLVAIRRDLWRKSWLRPTMVEPLAKDGDRERAQIVSELTLENLGEKASAFVGGFTS